MKSAGKGGLAAGAALGLMALVGFGGERVVVEAPARVSIPAGSFLRGSDTPAVFRAVALCRAEHPIGQAFGACQPELFEAELPFERVYVGAFSIDRHEVTREAYARCAREGACVPPRLGAGDARIGGPRHPVVGITAYDAEDYCRFVGGRLPSDDEWEKAARGVADARAFPWGEIWDPRLSNHGGEGGAEAARDGARHLAEVGAHPRGASPYGLLDAAGNVWEWTASPFSRGPRRGARATSASTRSIRGGSFRTTAITHRVAYRAGLAAADHAPDVGFRCAFDPS